MEVLELSASFFQSAFGEISSDVDGGYPQTLEPVWVLGCQYSVLHDREDLENDIRSRILFTYRKGFGPIGGTGPTSDVGWGCMLRCGQMMLAQALLNRHLGRDWRWKQGEYDPKYYEILRFFQDKKECFYSIHQIVYSDGDYFCVVLVGFKASMGVTEGKPVGEWFGPNTIAQVLRKLASYERWSEVVIHIALDNTVIIDDIYELCVIGNDRKASSCSQADKAGNKNFSGNATCTSKSQAACNSCVIPHNEKDTNPKNCCDKSSCIKSDISNKASDGQLCDESSMRVNGTVNNCASCAESSDKEQEQEFGWRPLLLIIPLRLGLAEINPVYIDSLKTCFTLPQSVGVMGGKPSHAHWFIGYNENKLMYFDPHTCQPYVDLTKPESSDDSYHCHPPRWMDVNQMDPSIAVGFYCNTRSDFESLCDSMREGIARGGSLEAMFELRNKRPAHFPPARRYDTSTEGAACQDFTMINTPPRQMDSEDEFELVNMS